MAKLNFKQEDLMWPGLAVLGLACALVGCGASVAPNPNPVGAGASDASAEAGAGAPQAEAGASQGEAGRAHVDPPVAEVEAGVSGRDADTECYSPTQNLTHAYDAGAKGCPCNPQRDEAVCILPVALICESGFWQAVEDGPCEPQGPTGNTACGARAGSTCKASEYCAYEPGEYCGAADAESVCKPRPEACIQLYAPVCGCDQKTYSNSCAANAAGTGVDYTGECKAP